MALVGASVCAGLCSRLVAKRTFRLASQLAVSLLLLRRRCSRDLVSDERATTSSSQKQQQHPSSSRIARRGVCEANSIVVHDAMRDIASSTGHQPPTRSPPSHLVQEEAGSCFLPPLLQLARCFRRRRRRGAARPLHQPATAADILLTKRVWRQSMHTARSCPQARRSPTPETHQRGRMSGGASHRDDNLCAWRSLKAASSEEMGGQDAAVRSASQPRRTIKPTTTTRLSRVHVLRIQDCSRICAAGTARQRTDGQDIAPFPSGVEGAPPAAPAGRA